MVTTDAELLAFYRFQATHWRNLALTYKQQLDANRNTPTREPHHGRGLHRDPTATQAVANITREQKEGK